MLGFKEEKALTLIEVLITLAIVGIVFIPLLVYFSNSIVFTSEAGKRAQAIKLASNTMENIKLAALSNWSILDFDQEKNYLDTYVDELNYSLKANDYMIKLSNEAIVEIDEDGIEDGRLITITVYWDNKNKSIDLSSLVMKR